MCGNGLRRGVHYRARIARVRCGWGKGSEGGVGARGVCAIRLAAQVRFKTAFAIHRDRQAAHNKAHAIAALDHPNIITISDIDEAEGE